MRRIELNRKATLRVDFYDDDGALVDADGPVTVTGVTHAGVQSFTGAATYESSGAYSFVVPPQNALRLITVTWSGVFGGHTEIITETVEIVSSFIVTIAEVRNNTYLSSTVKYPKATIERARDQAEDLFFRYCHLAFTPRFGVENVSTGASRLTKYNEYRRVLGTSGADVVTNVIVGANGQLSNQSFAESTGFTNVYVEHGMAYAPSDIKRAMIEYIEYLLFELTSQIPDRGISITNDFGVVRLSVAGPNRATGLPEVDETLNLYRRNMGAVVA